MPKPARLIFTIFAIVGSVMVAVALFLCLRTGNFLRSAATADAVVVENVWSGSYHPRVRFRTNSGQEFTFVSSTGTSPASYREGESVQVLYDPDSPANASINGFVSLWLLPLIFGGIGIVFCSVGLVPFAWYRHVQRRDDWLRANGRRIQADFDRVEVNTSLRVNGQCPWRIVCQWLDPMSNQMHVYRSHNLWYDPARFITGKTMEVIVDPDNPKRYVVETSFLPKLAE